MSARSYTPLEALLIENVSVIRDLLIERGAGAKPLTGFGAAHPGDAEARPELFTLSSEVALTTRILSDKWMLIETS